MTNKEIKIAYTEYASLEELSAEDKVLAESAIEAVGSAYAPYSNFHVGAAVRFNDGEIVKGIRLVPLVRLRCKGCDYFGR